MASKDFYRNQRKFLRATGKSGALRLKRQLEKLDKVASGRTLESIGYRLNFNIRENTSSVEVFADQSLVYIDQGRRPGGKQPPPQAIEQWVKTLGIIFRNKNGKPLPLKQQVFLIGRSIARDGIDPTNIIDLVFNKKSFVNLTEKRLRKATLEDIQVRFTLLSKEVNGTS